MAHKRVAIAKANAAELAAARELVEAKVNELSVVDRPAIRRQFLVLKNLVEDGMGEELDALTDGSIAKSEIEVHAVELVETLKELGIGFENVDVAKAMPENLSNALRVTIPWMHKMASQAEGGVRSAIMQSATLLTHVAKGQFPTQKKDPEDSMAGKAKTPEEIAAEEKAATEEKARKAKLSPEEIAAEAKEEEKKKAAAKAKEEEDLKAKAKAEAEGKQFPFKPGEEDEEGKGKKKQKAHSLDPAPAAVVKFDENDQLTIVTKGRKMLTDERKDTLKTTATQLLGMLKEADPEMFKSAMAEIMEKELPSNAKVPSLVRPVGEGSVPPTTVTSAKSDAPEWAQTIAENQQEIAKRLDKIEGVRPPSTSVDGDGNPTTPVEKGGTMWGSILNPGR